LASFIGIVAYQDNGYVLIGRGYTTIEMSLSLFILLQIILYVVITFLLRSIKKTWHLPSVIRQHHQLSKKSKAQKTSKQGLIALAQGQWKKAEKALIKNVGHSETPLLNYLSAARAAQKLNEPERRDHYLSMAHKSMPEADFAVELTQAELQLAHGQLEQSLATLVHLRSLSPKHSHVMHLLAQLYEKLNSWQELRNLLPDLKKYKVLNTIELYRLQKISIQCLLKQAMSGANNAEKSKTLIPIWASLPKELKADSDLILNYSSQLIDLNQDDIAEPLLKTAIKQQWQIQLIYLYGLIKSSHSQQQLNFAESLIKQHGQNPILLLTLGRLCLTQKLWGKAQSYLEASLGINPMAETYKELGELMAKLDEAEKSSDYFKQGLLLAAKNFSYQQLPE